MTPEEIIKRVDRLAGDRQNYNSFWQDVAKYCLPRKAYITRTRTAGSKYDYDIYDCFDKDTEILTDKGWKFFDELDYSDKALSLNPDTGIADYNLIDEIIVQDYEGKLKQFENNSISFSITPNHKLYLRPRETENWELKKISDIDVKSFALKRDFKWVGKEEEFIPIKPSDNGRETAGIYIFKMDDWLEFLGWFVSEGFIYYAKKANTYWITLSQSNKSNPDKCEEIKTLLGRMGLADTQYNDMDFRIGSRGIYEHLDKYVGNGSKNKRVPDYVRNLSPRQIRIFLNSYLKGDGYPLENGERRYNTCSKLLADDIQELILKTGSYARITVRDNIGRKRYYDNHWIETKNLDYLILEYTPERKTYDTYVYIEDIEDVDYKGKIYCATVLPHHLIYVRKDGACFWSGNSTAMQANLVLAAGLHSYLTNPNSRWFSLRVEDEELNKDIEVKTWLADTEERIYNILNGSNFNQQIHELYIDLGVFGVACMYEEEDETSSVRFYSRDIAEIYLCENEKEKIDTVFRKFNLTVRQAFEKWGESAGDVVKGFMDKKEYDKPVQFIHAVMPRYERDVAKEDAGNMPFKSIYIEVSKKHLISESGYNEFPYFTPRFNKNSGEVWGSSPAMVGFADIKMLNEMVKVLIRAAQKVVDPPLVLPHDGYLLPIKYGPGALNFRLKGSAQDKIEPLITNVNLPIGLEIIENYRTTIKKNYFVDLFLLLADPARKDMTATEVMQRVEEKMLILAPVLGRLMNEFLDPLINRTFSILWRTGKISPAPESLQGLPYVIEYISPLARAQKLDQMKSINNFLTLIGQIATVKPDVLDNIDEDEVVMDIQQLYGINPKYIRDEEEIKSIRDQRMQALQAQQELATVGQGAEIIKTGAEAEKTMRPETK